MENNSDTSLPTSSVVVARATASTMASTNHPAALLSPRSPLTSSSATTHKTRAPVTSTSVFVTFETETITFHPGGSVAHSSSPVPTTLVTTTTTAAASPAPEETTASAASKNGTGGSKAAAIGGAVGATIFGLLLIGLLAFCLFRRRRLERQANLYSTPTTITANGDRATVRGSDGRFYRLENIPLASLGKSKQTRGEQDETAGGGDESSPGQMVIEVVPAAEENRGPRLRTVRLAPAPASASAPAPHQERVLVPVPSPVSPVLPVPASYPLLAPPAPAPARPLRNVSSSVYSKPSQDEDMASKFSEESYEVDNNGNNSNNNSNGNSNGNSSGNTIWPAPLFASPASGQAQAAPAPAAAAGYEPGPSISTTTPHPGDRGGPSQMSTYVEPPSQSRWSPSTPTSDGSEEGLASRLQAQVAQVGKKLADKWKETKQGWKKGLLLGAAGPKEEKKPSKEERGKGKARDREIVVDPVNRGAPGWI